MILILFAAVIFPTLWEYLRSLGIAESNVYFLGLCISAVTVTDMFIGLFIGRLLDKSSRVLPVILVLNLFQIIGSFLYFIANSPTVLLISRFIEGNLEKMFHTKTFLTLKLVNCYAFLLF